MKERDERDERETGGERDDVDLSDHSSFQLRKE